AESPKLTMVMLGLPLYNFINIQGDLGPGYSHDERAKNITIEKNKALFMTKKN
ncbi:MAG: hypothetical protein RLZZ520_128, partial [Bacteroidota bacterium]